jgi:alpha-1,2-mannosyltransferase
MAISDIDRLAPVQPGQPAGSVTRWRALLALTAVAAATAVFLAYGSAFVGADFEVYYGGTSTMLAGLPLYDFATLTTDMPFTYPPFAALFFSPLTLLPEPLAAATWALISVLAMQATIWLLLRKLGVRDPVRRVRLTALTGLAMLPLAPVAFGLWVGQINLLLLLLVIFDVVRGGGRFRGVALGVACGLKLIPLIFVVYLLLTRQVRAARTAALTFATTILIGLALLPGDSVRYWFGTMTDVDRIAPVGSDPYNSSILGTLNRLPSSHTPAIWLALAVVVGTAGLALSIWASRRGHQLAGIVACGVTGVLISPISWLYHWVWCIPLLMLLATRAWRRDLTAAKVGVFAIWLAFAASFYWMVPQFLGQPVPDSMTLLFANLYVPLGIGILATLAVRLRRESRRSSLAADL